MLLSLMTLQFLETTIPISTVVGASNPDAVMLDAHVYSFDVSIDVRGPNEGLAACDPRARSSL